MSKRYIQGRKLFWASLALLLVLVVLPASLGLAEWWNTQVAGTQTIAYEMQSDNDTIAQPTENTHLYRIAAFVDDGTLNQAEQSVFWQANESWNEFIVQTGATTTDNKSYSNKLYFNLNITAHELIKENVNRIIIELKGINANTSIATNIATIVNGHIYTASESNYIINLKDISNPFANIIAYSNNTTSVKIAWNLDPAILKYAADHTTANNSRIIIRITGTDPAKDFFNEGQVIYFRIYAEHPHGRLVVSGYDFMEWVIAGFTGLGIVVLLVTSPAWNPTTHNGLIEKMINRAKYRHSHRNSRRRSSSRRRTHRTHRSSSRHRRTTHHRRRR